LPVYVDRINNRLLADPQNGGPWFVVSVSGGGSVPAGSLTDPGILQLEDSTNSTSTSKAATPNSVRQAFSLADTANSVAQGASANATTALNNSQAAVSTANSVSGTANTALSTANAAVATANAATATANSAASAVSGKLDLTGGTITGDVIFSNTGRIGFEGSTDDVFETYLAVVNPTADRTITLPNATGTVALLETANTWSSAQVFQGTISFPSASCSNQLYIDHSGSIAFEGSSADDFETFLYATNPTADRSIYLPNASGTIALSEGLATVATTGAYGDLSGRPTLGTSAALNVAAAGNAAAGEVVKGNDTRLTTNISYTASTRALASSTGTGATLPLVADAAAGLAPASGGGTSNYLRADGSWAVPPGAALTDGDRGDITVSGGGTTWTIDNGVVSYAKMQAVSTGNRLLGKAGATPGPVEEIACSQAGRDLIAASDPASQRTVLGLGALAQQDTLGSISSTGTIGVTASRPLITTTGGAITTGTFGSSATTFCEGNDSRLSDTRLTPNALTLASNGTGSAPGSTFNGSAARTISYNSVGAAAETHTHGNISSGGAIGATSGLPVITGTNGILQTGTFGSTIGTFCQGNDARLSDTRNTSNALTFDGSGTGAAAGSTFNGSAARTISFNTIGAAASGHTHGQITNAGAIGTTSGLPIITGAGGVLQAGSFGTGATDFCAGNDSRLSNARTTVNALTFSNTGSGDASGTTFNGSSSRTLSYNSIGAAPLASPSFTGNVGIGATLETGSQISTGSAQVRVGGLRTGTGESLVDFYHAAGQIGARIVRYGGTDSNFEFQNNGTGSVAFTLAGTPRLVLESERLGFMTGGGTSAGIRAYWAGLIRGAASSIYHYVDGQVENTVTGQANVFRSAVTTANSAGAFTLPTLRHFDALGSVARGTNTTITTQVGFRASGDLTSAGTNYGFLSSIGSGTGRFNFYADGDAANYFAGTIASLGSYTATTAAAVNMTIDSAGDIRRSTSSIRYKKDVEDLGSQYADNVVFGARPVWYRSTCEADNPAWGFYGLIAEELADIDPRLVHWGRPSKRILLQEKSEAILDDDGNVLEPACEEQWVDAEDTDAPLRPEGVAYDRLTVMLIDVVQRQQAAIEALQLSVQAMGAGVSGAGN
jgi:hypothetical protein